MAGRTGELETYFIELGPEPRESFKPP